MNASLSLSSITTPLNKFFGKYHATIFFTVIALLLAGAILVLYLSTLQGTPEEDPSAIVNANFDTETAKQIEQLRNSDQSTKDLSFPTERKSPFVE